MIVDFGFWIGKARTRRSSVAMAVAEFDGSFHLSRAKFHRPALPRLLIARKLLLGVICLGKIMRRMRMLDAGNDAMGNLLTISFMHSIS